MDEREQMSQPVLTSVKTELHGAGPFCWLWTKAALLEPDLKAQILVMPNEDGGSLFLKS